MFLFSKDKIESRDLFAREASIINEVQHKKKFFIADTCKFDIIKSELFDFSRNKRTIFTPYHISSFKALDKFYLLQKNNVSSMKK
jgi:hypothetical protein